MASSILDQFMESMNAFFSGKAVWYGGTGSGAQITGSPTGGTGSGSSFVPGYDENGVYIDMEVVADTAGARQITLEYVTYAGGVTENYSANGTLISTILPETVLQLRHTQIVMAEEFEFQLPDHPEVTVGTAGNDLFTGRDILIGGGGNDTIIGSAGIDILVAGSGNNILEGGAGADREIATSTSTVSMVPTTTTRSWAISRAIG
jgi:Ca2+-binding RTX toxin-like protein